MFIWEFPFVILARKRTILTILAVFLRPSKQIPSQYLKMVMTLFLPSSQIVHNHDVITRHR